MQSAGIDLLKPRIVDVKHLTERKAKWFWSL